MKNIFCNIFLPLFFVFFLSPPFIFSQDKNSNAKQVPDSFEIHKVLILPFNPKMYNSDADKEILEESMLLFPQLLSRFRSGIGVAVRQRMPGWWESRLLSDEEDTARDLKVIYASLVYNYELLDEKSSGAKNASPKKDESKEDKKIVKGQLKVEQDQRPKFMNIKIKNDTLMRYLSEKYGADNFLFLNQLDISNDLSDYVANANKTYSRVVKVHYTILNKKGKQFFSGIATSKFSAKTNDPQVIINKNFMEAAKGVVSHLPPPVAAKRVKRN